MLYYNDLKAVHYHKELNQLKNNEMVYPRFLSIDPVAGCNHDCYFCSYRYARDDDLNALFNEKDLISYDKMVEIFDDCVKMGTKAVELTGGGEPTAHPQFVELLRDARKRSLEVGLITNGASNNWKRQQGKMLKEISEIEFTRFSLDSATAKTHALIHRGRADDFETAVENIRLLCQNRTGKLAVGISFVILKENHKEIGEAVRLAEELGVDYIRFVAFRGGDMRKNQDYLPDETITSIERDLDSLESSTIEITNQFSERSKSHESFGVYESNAFCYYSRLTAVVGADLRLYPCCVWKYRPQGVVSELSDKTFRQAWEAREFYDRKFDIAETCETCHIKPKNDFISYMLESDPRHVNFL